MRLDAAKFDKWRVIANIWILVIQRHNVIAAYRDSEMPEYRKELDVIVKRLMKENGLRLRLNEVLYHEEFMKGSHGN